ncbi:hypothetical protein GYMLUDRAFT_37324 [Collybiopsis luxurians FD-317 M1]|nr:hypothetical protein GYMLUDRAFT_37324 [Collybiopsis luxurians FD-317 M1]
MPLIHVSPVDYLGVVRCFVHELEASIKVSQSEENPKRAYYCCQKGSENPQKCDFFC